MKYENLQKVEKICREIERIQDGTKMIEQAVSSGHKLTFGISTSDALGFRKESAYFFLFNDYIDDVIIEGKNRIAELKKELETL